MESCYFELHKVPDFSLSKYASLSETGPGGVLTQHQAFWRQLNQWGKIFGGSIHLIYQYNPEKTAGQRMKIICRFDAPDAGALRSACQIMKASVLAPYYDTLVPEERSGLEAYTYSCQINLIKKERFISSSTGENDIFYTTSEWKMNPSGRLYSMMRLLEVSGVHSAYSVDLYPVDYSLRLEDDLSVVMPHLRELNSFKVKTGAGSVSSGGRDENAKRALDYYEDLEENINASPHFLVNIQVFSETEDAARQILDAAASEALSEGNYELISEMRRIDVETALDEGHFSMASPNAPDQLQYLPHLMTVEEMVAFSVFPVLFPGENVELPKETVPNPEKGMLLGVDTEEHDIYVPWKNLSKHAFLAGMPGSGKTNTMMYLIHEMHRARIPVLILEPAKREYRSLTALEGMEDVSIFSPCANSMFPIHINPFEFPEGMKLADHINRLLDVFNGTFQLDPPMPMLLTEGIQKCYEELYWLPGMVNRGQLEYPTMSMLYHNIEKLLDKYQYSDEVRGNMESILQVRIGSLLSREMGDIFDVKKSTFAPEEWLEKSVIMELASLGTAPSNFMMLLLMTLIREALDQIPYEPEKTGGKPRHTIFLEEAHNLIADTSVQAAGILDPKVAATAFIVKMLAEVRALGEGIVIADQLPTAMAPEVVKNTSLKIGLRLTSQDERELLGSSMSADSVQMEQMGIFNPGRCLVGYEGLLKPFEMQIPEFKGDDILNEEQLLTTSAGKAVYQKNMLKSAEIMSGKFREQIQYLKEKNAQFEKDFQKYQNRLSQFSQDYVKCEQQGALAPASKVKELKLVRKKLEEEKKKLKHIFEEQIEAWMRQVLDITLYYTIQKEQKAAQDKVQGISEEMCRQAEESSLKWKEQIAPWLIEARKAYADFKQRWEKHKFMVSPERAEGFVKQQKILAGIK